MRRFLVAGNWKMNGSSEMTADLISGIARRVLDAARLSEQKELGYDILVCPPAPYLSQAIDSSESQPIAVGGQNISQFDSGAYTGETSLSMLAEIGCKYVLIGHSERRELFKETNKDVAEKFLACVNHQASIVPVLCIGETLAQRQAGQTEDIIAAQLDAVIDAVGIAGFANAVIAYEPVWAIGTGETASPEQAQEVHAFIRAKLDSLNIEIAQAIRIVYGGSVKPSNADELFAQKDIDGGLIGGASLQVNSFAGICEAVQKIIEKT
jgi:triosephosphate isomerase